MATHRLALPDMQEEGGGFGGICLAGEKPHLSDERRKAFWPEYKARNKIRQVRCFL